MIQVKDECDIVSAKRKRAPNFTDKEIRTLMNLVFANAELVENKKTDSQTWKIKDLIWNTITETFNSDQYTTKRTVEALRQKYDSVKKYARKKEAKNKEEETKAVPDYIELEDYEKELLRVLELYSNNFNQADSPETKPNIDDIKTSPTHTPDNLSCTQYTASKDDNFTIIDDDIVCDLSNNLVKPPISSVMNHIPFLKREERRSIIEHRYRMRTLQMRRRILLSKERRSREEHRRKMELLELEIAVKRKEKEKRKQSVINTQSMRGELFIKL